MMKKTVKIFYPCRSEVDFERDHTDRVSSKATMAISNRVMYTKRNGRKHCTQLMYTRKQTKLLKYDSSNVKYFPVCPSSFCIFLCQINIQRLRRYFVSLVFRNCNFLTNFTIRKRYKFTSHTVSNISSKLELQLVFFFIIIIIQIFIKVLELKLLLLEFRTTRYSDFNSGFTENL